jgi:hypothetical protein
MSSQKTKQPQQQPKKKKTKNKKKKEVEFKATKLRDEPSSSRMNSISISRKVEFQSVTGGKGLRIRACEPWVQLAVKTSANVSYQQWMVYNSDGSYSDLSIDTTKFASATSSNLGTYQTTTLVCLPVTPTLYFTGVGNNTNTAPMGGSIELLSACFRKFKVHSMKLHWVPQINTTTWYGSITTAYDPVQLYNASAMVGSVSNKMTYFISQIPESRSTAIYQPVTYEIPVIKDWRYSNWANDTAGAHSENEQSEARQVFAGSILMKADAQLSTGAAALDAGQSIAMGQFFVETDIEFDMFCTSFNQTGYDSPAQTVLSRLTSRHNAGKEEEKKIKTSRSNSLDGSEFVAVVSEKDTSVSATKSPTNNQLLAKDQLLTSLTFERDALKKAIASKK